MLEWSLAVLREVAEVEQIVVALPAGIEAPEGTVGVQGGEHRSASVLAALRAAHGERVLVHDAARPLAPAALFSATLAALEDCDAAIAAAPVTDTVKEVDSSGRVVRTLDRSALWAVQTPQAFRRPALERALAVGGDVLAAAPDDAWLVERAGGLVRVVMAPAENLKVTTPADLRVAELALRERRVVP